MNGTKEVLVCAATFVERNACVLGIQASGITAAFRFLLTGIGPRNARFAIEKYLQHETIPSLIVSTGFAGAISSDIPYQSWITAQKVFSEEKEVQGVNFKNVSIDAKKCSLVSLPRVFRQGQPIPYILASKNTSLAVDMESAALAKISSQHKIPFMVLRMISDTPEQPLPNLLHILSDISLTSRSKGKLWSRVPYIYAAISHPLGAVQVWRKTSEWLVSLEEGWTKYAPVIAELKPT